MLTRASVFEYEQAASAEATASQKQRRSTVKTVAYAQADAKATARRMCADCAADVAHTLLIADDCWVTRPMVAQLVQGITQQPQDRCKLVRLYRDARPWRTRTLTKAAGPAAKNAKAEEQRRVAAKKAKEGLCVTDTLYLEKKQVYGSIQCSGVCMCV
jgi:hypothetical protein